MAPGSRLPHRVPITRPSSGVKLMVVATLRRRCIAHMLAPLPRWATTTRPSAATVPIGKHTGDILVGEAVKSVATDSLDRDGTGQRESRRNLRLGMVEGGVEAGDLGQFRVQLRDSGNGRQI